ncbi:hypothetical protein CPC08DRAFT_705782, partial [Agrocybe pediades]
MVQSAKLNFLLCALPLSHCFARSVSGVSAITAVLHMAGNMSTALADQPLFRSCLMLNPRGTCVSLLKTLYIGFLAVLL